MTSKLSKERQAEIFDEGGEVFKSGTSTNPYKEGTKAYAIFLQGWQEAKKNHYGNT